MRKTTKNIYNLYITPKENEERKRKKIIDDSDDSDNEYEIKKEVPEAILQEVINEEAKIVATGDNKLISKIFTLENADILVIKDEKGEYWYRNNDICKLLEYANPRDVLKKNINENYKKSYANIGVDKIYMKKIDPQTMFIDESGLFILISKSKKPQAEILWRKITKEILPTLFRTGTVSLPLKQSEIDHLNKSIYDSVLLSDYEGFPVVYLSYIGFDEGKHKMKWGLSTDFKRRELDEHRKDFKTFVVKGIWKTMAYKSVEDKINTNFESRNMKTTMKITKIIKNKKVTSNKTEIIALNAVNNLDYCLNMIDDVVKKTIYPQELEYIEKINKLENDNKYEILKVKYDNAQKEIKILEESIKMLKENIDDLRKKRLQ